MVIRNVTVNDCTPETIVIGRRGTFETMQIVFDLTYLIENYGDGTAVLALKRSQDSSAYPAVAAQDGNTLTWVVSDVDTYYVGAGVCQLMWYVDDGLAKTIIYPTVVMKDILSTAEEPPDGYENWIEHLIDLGTETLQNAQNAAQSASDAKSAKDDAVTAKEAAEEAAETAQEAVVHAPIIQNGYWYIWNDGQYVDTGVRAEGQKGDKGDTGEKGDTGNGIASITKTGTAGLVDTYTVTYTDGTTTMFTVTNGAKGDKGDTGATGNGIQSITKTGTSGNVDTYTITYTNGQTTTFTVTNGAVSSVAGKTGAVTLDANDVAFSESGTYDDGTVGKELSNQKNAIGQLDDVVNDPVHGLAQKAPLIVNTASGDIASFSDGADSMPIKSLVASIEPVQDLHGYENPWPGGGGKNKFHFGASRASYTWSDGSSFADIYDNDAFVVINGTATSAHVFSIPDGKFYLNAGDYAASMTTNDTMQFHVYDQNGVTICNVSAGTAQFTIAEGQYYTYDITILPGTYSNLKIGIQIESGSTATAWSSYENLCPISGHTGMTVTRTGVNVWDEVWEAGGINNLNGENVGASNTIRTKWYIPVKPQTEYYIKYSNIIIACAYDKDKQFVKTIAYSNGNRTVNTNDDRIRYIRVQFSDYGTTYNNDISINYPSTDTTYHSGTSNVTIPIAFPTEAGTVYGSLLTLNPDRTGTLVVDRAKKVFNGTEELEVVVSGIQGYAMFALGAKNTVIPASGISNLLKAVNSGVSQTDWSQHVQNSSAYNRDQIAFRFNSDFQTSDMYRAELVRLYQAGTPLEVVYMLASPQTYQLTAEQISGILTTLYGQNNVWTDVGAVSVDYPADTKLYIDGLTAPDEDMIADANIASGKYFVVNNQLYLSTAAIAAGASIVPGTNCTATNLAEALNALNT